MKPRSSSAVISRWIPDLDRRSRASFISSKLGGTPSRCIRLLMKSRRSSCFLVSMARSPVACLPFVLRMFTICVNTFAGKTKRAGASVRASEGHVLHGLTGFAGRVARRADDQPAGLAEDAQKRAVLTLEGADPIGGDTGPHVVLARSVGADRCGQNRALALCRRGTEPEHGADHRGYEDMPANHCRDRVSRKAHHHCIAQTAGHQRLARAHRNLVEGALEAHGLGHLRD